MKITKTLTPVFLVLSSLSFVQAQLSDLPESQELAPVCTSIGAGSRDRDTGDIRTSWQVSTLQHFLQDNNYLDQEPTGYFGAKTYRAVKEFQSDNGISATGYVGPLTQLKLHELRGTSCSSSATGSTSNTDPTNTNLATAPSITVNSPNGGEIYKIGDKMNIQWSLSKAVSNATVALTLVSSNGEGGVIKYVNGSFGEGKHNYEWTIGSMIQGGDVIAMVEPGTGFKILAKLYQGTVTCLGYCAPGTNQNPTVLWSDQSNSGFTLQAANTNAPAIISIKPASVKVGSSVMIQGSGFTQTGNNVYLNGGVFSAGRNLSSDGTTLTFAIPSALSAACTMLATNPCTSVPSPIPSTVSVIVENSNGTSNSKLISVAPATANDSFLAWGGKESDCINMVTAKYGFYIPGSCSIGGACNNSAPREWGACINPATVPPASCATGTLYNGTSCINPETIPLSVQLTPDTSTAFGGTATLSWTVTPDIPSVSCVAAGGNLNAGLPINRKGTWITPNLYTDTQYGMMCTKSTTGEKVYKYAMVKVGTENTSGSAPTISLTITPSSGFIDEGGNATFQWSVVPTNSICVAAGGNLNAGQMINTTGTWTTPNLYTTTQYGMKCTNPSNGLISYKYATITVTAASNPEVSLSAASTSIGFGGNTTLTWSVPSNSSCSAAGGNLANGQAISTSGSWQTPNLYTTQQYGIRCVSNSSGLSTTKYVTISVAQQIGDSTTSGSPAIDLTPSMTISYGGTANLSWNVSPTSNVTCAAAGGNLNAGQAIPPSGSWTTPALYTTTQYGIKCTNTTNNLSSYKYTMVTVSQATEPEFTLSSTNPNTYGGQAVITWNLITPGLTCVASGGNLASGTSVTSSGSWTTPALYTTTQYGLRCTAPAGQTSTKYVTVTVPAQTTSASVDLKFSGAKTIDAGGTATLTWSATPSNVQCVGAGGSVPPGTVINPTGSWVTPKLYTTTQYGIKCTDPVSGKSDTDYVTITVRAQTSTTPTSDSCASLDATRYYSDQCCTTNTGTQRCGTQNRSADTCLALDASLYFTNQCCTTLTGTQRCGTKPVASNVMGPVYTMGDSGTVLGASNRCVNLPSNMHRGYESSHVSQLQTFLQNEGMLSEVTGFYGDKTVAAVKAYQQSKGLPMTGMVYGFTRAAIKSDSCQ